MRYIFLLLLLATASFWSGCKKESREAAPEMDKLVGKWKGAAYQTVENGEVVWKEWHAEEEGYLEFRSDGILLDEKGLPPCCLPRRYNIDGKRFEAIPTAPVEDNPLCYLVDCASCSELNIEWVGADRIVTYCAESKFKSELVRL